MVTNITLRKITESIEYVKILEVTDYEGEIHQLIGLKYISIFAYNSSTIINTPHSKILVFCETKLPIQVRVDHTPWYLTI